ncbi:hypothetical protein B9Q02_02440 [Candidatus Marsarchaeota G1 archaeon BE_D]|uniref:AAA+ ATPase domain-containing protein n=1 Tax=Candidatus Marsarchaeota G1 archaeon BE_D TaxID=1978156 RepID=A0A2R6AJ45_9ARCH|nr:MAG: hypothetical protein B9Q02_02440 [Candidatus Marsarchaeota G1 archaeon BE_D]
MEELSDELSTLLERFKTRDTRALARIITLAERSADFSERLLDALGEQTHRRAHVIGVTGAPGVGKSTLIDKLVLKFREKGKSVGVIAIDPSSVFSGGAVLGDRSRMNRLSVDPQVFIRSFGTAGELGGLSRGARDAIKILRAFGKDVIIVETTGTGQNEVDVALYVHTSVVVTMPGLGDDLQLMEAGFPEIGDVFVLNKSDLAGSDASYAELKNMVQLRYAERAWKPRVIKTVGVSAQGVDELLRALEEHYDHLVSSGELSLRENAGFRKEVEEIIKERLEHELKRYLENRFSEQSVNHNPYKVAKSLLGEFTKLLKV